MSSEGRGVGQLLASPEAVVESLMVRKWRILQDSAEDDAVFVNSFVADNVVDSEVPRWLRSMGRMLMMIRVDSRLRWPRRWAAAARGSRK